MATPTPVFKDMPPQSIRRLSVQEYLDMHRLGILTEDDHLELLEGWLVEKMSKNPPYLSCSDLLLRSLMRLTPEQWLLRTESPITLTYSVPEPDFIILRGEVADYVNRLATGEDAALVIEILDSSLANDRGYKLQLYANANIPVYWLINLMDRQIEVYSDPEPASSLYRTAQVFRANETFPLTLDGVEIATIKVKDILL